VRVELRGIQKCFGQVRANDGISLVFEAGTIHGLLGENGAGKTTLMKVLSGFIASDGGEILLDGRPVSLRNPAEAIAAGVGMLHQDPLDFPPLSVLDNFLLGRPGRLIPDVGPARRQLAEFGGQLGFHLDEGALVSSLTVGERQQLEIVRLLSLGVQVLILDEPTTGISAEQKVSLFSALRRLAAESKTIIFVSHKLEDVQDLCHEVSVLRQGKLVGQRRLPCSNDELVEIMFGQVLTKSRRPEVDLGDERLELRGLHVAGGRVRVSGLNLRVRRGEVIGLAGLEGSGQELILRVSAGLARPAGGGVLIDRREMTGLPYRRFLDAGVAFLPAGRLEEGLVPGLDLCEHAVLTDRNGARLVDWTAARARAEHCIRDFDIRGRPESLVEELSGGNQQRALLSMLPPDLKLLLMEHPTRGLDLESAAWVWERLLERRDQGTAIIFTSSDLDEIMENSDRVLVFFDGRVTGELLASETSTGELGQRMSGLDGGEMLHHA